MAAPADWAQRRFAFDFPAELYPSILMRLRGTPARLEELLAGADEARLRRRPADGKWSALERAGHLGEIERLWETRLSEFLAGASILSPADMSNASTFEADYNKLDRSEVLSRFRRARLHFVNRLDALAPAEFSRTALHPRLQVPMRLVDGLYFSAEHDDHELAWVWELLHAKA